MKKYWMAVMALLAFTAFVLVAADIDGTWTAETQGFKGPQTVTLTLKADGKVLKGNMDKGRGAVEISEGMIDGKNVMFKVVTEGKAGKQTAEYKGTLNSPTELKLQTQGKQGPVDMTFKKK
jgi:hypothetical protein